MSPSYGNLLLDRGASLWLDLSRASPDLAQFVVAGCMGGEGATTIAQALAFAAADGGSKQVLLIDANKHGQGLTTLFGKQGRTVTAGKTGAPNPYKGLRSISAGLDFLPYAWGQLEELSVAEVQNLSTWARNEYDLVIWDCPGILRSIAFKRVVAQAQNVVLVTETDTTTNNHLRSALEEIGLQGGKTVAILRNRAGRKLFGFSAD